MNANLYMGPSLDPISLNGVDHVDYDLSAVDEDIIRAIVPQADLLSNDDYRLYFRIDDQATAGGTTLALFKPMGVLTHGGDMSAFPIWIDPTTTTVRYLHLLLTDSVGTAANGGALDQLLLLACKSVTD